MEVTNRTLREERAQKIKEAKALSAKGKLNQADQRKFDDLMSEAEELKTQIDHIENRGGSTQRTLGGRIGLEDRQEDPKQKEHRRAFGNYLRHGVARLDPADREILNEFRDMGTGGQGAYPGATAPGGFLVPVGFTDSIVEALRYYGPLLNDNVVTILDTTTGAVLPFPTSDDLNVYAEILGENQQATTADVNIGQIMMGAYKYSSRMVKVSLELLQDSAFSIEDFLISAFARRFGRTLVNHFTVGTGAANSMPMGILTSTLANGNLVTAVGSSANDGTAAGGNTIGSDDLINLEHSIDPLYRPNASYMMNDSTWKAIRRVKDKYGKPLYEAPLIANAPATIGGYPIYINPNLDSLQLAPSSPQVARNTVLFGDFKRFLVRRVKQMSILVLTERYADMAQTAYIAFARYDSSPMFGGTGVDFPFGLLRNIY